MPRSASPASERTVGVHRRRIAAGVLFGVIALLTLGAADTFFTQPAVPDTRTSESARPLTPADMPDLPPLAVGDLVFRRGFGTESSLIVRAQGETRSPFSHVGLVTAVKPVEITHATTSDDPARRDQVIVSTLSDFLAQGSRFGVRRPDWSDDVKRRTADRAQALVGRPFRLSPDDPSALYCTTLVTRAAAPDVTLRVTPEPIDVPVIGGRYLMPAALWEADGMRTIYMH